MISKAMLDSIVVTYMVPTLAAAAFQRHRHLFLRSSPEAVSGLAAKLGSGGTKVTLEAGVSYRAWNEFISASSALKNPVASGDWSYRATDPASPYGPTTEKWWTLDDSGSETQLGRDLEKAVISQVLPAIELHEHPQSDMDQLLRLFNRGVLTGHSPTLSRLYFWLVRFEAARPEVDRVRNALVSTGHAAMVNRIEGMV